MFLFRPGGTKKVRLLFSLLLFVHILFLLSAGTPIANSLVQAEQKTDFYAALESERGFFSSIRVAFDPHLPPFQFLEGQEYRGFNMDLMQVIAEAEGLQIHWVPMTLSDSVTALEQGSIDVILGVHYKAHFYEGMEFSERFFTSSIIMLIPKEETDIKSLSDLSERVVAMQRDTLEYDFLQNIRRIKYHITSNQEEALRLLTMGRADAFVGSRKTAEYFLQKQGLEDQYLFIERYVLPLEYTLAVDQQNPLLLQALNRGLQTTMVNGSYKQLYDQWFQDESSTLRKRLEQTIQLFILVGAAASGLFFIGLRWNRQLKKQVDKKTEALLLLNHSLTRQVQETKNSQQLKEQILDSSPRGIVTFDRHGEITSINTKAMTLGNIEGNPVGSMYHSIPILSHLLSSKLDEVMKLGKQFHGEATLKIEKEERFLRYYVYPLYDYQNQMIGTILSFEDMTDEKKVREQLFEQEKSQALIQLVAGLAHEIRNPLTSIKTFVELIPSKIHSARFQQEITTHVPKEIERLNQLIEELMNYAKPKSMSKELINVTELIESTIILFERLAEHKGFSIETKLETPLFIKADSNQLKQIMINLFLNSIEALEEKVKDDPPSPLDSPKNESDIFIHAWSEGTTDGNRVFIQLQDKGAGMSKTQLKKVMEPFYTTKAQGTGLGLAISHQFIHENGGTLHIESEEGVGTTMILSFRKDGKENDQESINY
ncbi:transporter substrate-binding domain-containing protein [Caldalkalibacillus mannanilyticus]|uniref:transporter substrate-binding domain-containing protein n=1 Tax=Caldalkalibacillus mannanilyticus TaxID=1418 RepID=UPI00046B05AD|nr:transporter substrate-binding domain-containing protein [Caldalkalibacillus mannanilyticus]